MTDPEIDSGAGAFSQASRGPVRRLLVGLDVGGTKIEGLAVDEKLALQAQVRLAMDASSGQAAVDSILAAIRQVMDRAGGENDPLAAIGLGIPGQVKDGIVSHAVNLKLDAYPLVEKLRQVFAAPVELENDVRAAAVGVYQHFLKHEPVESLAYLSIGTGISAGVILEGRLYRGRNGMAGEVGHVVVDPGGRRCNCGLRGCLETVAAGPAVAREAQKAVRAGLETSLRASSHLNAEEVYQAAQAGDLVARRIVRRASRYLARAAYALLMSYDVDLLVIGGGVSHSGAAFMDPLLKEVDALRRRSNLARSMLAGERIVLMPADFNAGAWGAVALAKQALNG